MCHAPARIKIVGCQYSSDLCVVCCHRMLTFDVGRPKPAAGRGIIRLTMACAFYAGLKQADLADIIAYLHTVLPLQ